MDGSPDNSQAFFYIGLFGVVMTGLLLGIGGDNYWAPAHGFWFTPPTGEGKLLAILVISVMLVGACDIVALGVVLGGAVLIVQRLRGRT